MSTNRLAKQRESQRQAEEEAKAARQQENQDGLVALQNDTNQPHSEEQGQSPTNAEQDSDLSATSTATTTTIPASQPQAPFPATFFQSKVDLPRTGDRSHEPHLQQQQTQTQTSSPPRSSPSRKQGASLTDVHHTKSNLMLIGPSGSGKTLLMSTLASALSVPFVSIDATRLTSSGYVGDDVDIIGRRLLAEARRIAGTEATEEDIRNVAERGIVFIDEVDKLAKTSSGSGQRDIGGEGVQQALLRLLEGCVLHIQGPGPGTSPTGQAQQAQPKQPQQEVVYQIDTSSVLFVASGAFGGLQDIIKARQPSENDSPSSTAVLESDLIAFGLIPEFVGRLPSISTLDPLTEHDLVRILTEPRNSLLSQYTSLLRSSNVSFLATTAALREIAHMANQTSTGARSLRRIFEDSLLDVMYAAPGGSIRYALLDQAAVKPGGEVKVWSRGGQHAFMNAYEDEERRFTPDTTPPQGKKTQTRAGVQRPRRKEAERYIDPTSQQLIDEAEESGRGNVKAKMATSPTISTITQQTGLTGLQLSTIARRMSRPRLNRPSRVGNLRVQVGRAR